ncbi:unnamed protein product [Arabidopsis arenosa]|uniref:Uncharacterized protein n=1 Tax=Arabidopsis arenosa TaxID=38785 RepID=A0A8S2A5G8_ARAAE|nr:unnamed protein product [Arabidopsis arenosa]
MKTVAGVFIAEAGSEKHGVSIQRVTSPCAVDDSTGHGASDGPRESLAINEVRSWRLWRRSSEQRVRREGKRRTPSPSSVAGD